jgi:hypothetical protein
MMFKGKPVKVIITGSAKSEFNDLNVRILPFLRMVVYTINHKIIYRIQTMSKTTL